jgi:hypothetical protein
VGQGISSSSQIDEAFARFKRLDWMSTAFFIVAVVAVLALVGSGWSWPYFVWGLAAGTLAVALVWGMTWLGYRGLGASAEEIVRLQAKTRSRYSSVYAGTIVVGAGVGALAARLGSPWPDVGFSAVVLLSQVPALVLFPKLRRGAREATTSGDR